LQSWQELCKHFKKWFQDFQKAGTAILSKLEHGRISKLFMTTFIGEYIRVCIKINFRIIDIINSITYYNKLFMDDAILPTAGRDYLLFYYPDEILTLTLYT